jgi:TetR/AcrR family transcriptional repressor of lmrAB and yxaGH operons
MAPAATSTRSRLLRAALKLFRRHGYHGTGINEILALAEVPKGSMYHHFPGGKEEVACEVVRQLAGGVVALVEAHAGAAGTPERVRRVGAALAETLARTRHELCALFAAFVAERESAPKLAAAVSEAYAAMQAPLASALVAEGRAPAEAARTAQLVVMLLEGGSLVAAAQGAPAAFALAVDQAARLCEAPPPAGVPPRAPRAAKTSKAAKAAKAAKPAATRPRATTKRPA